MIVSDQPADSVLDGDPMETILDATRIDAPDAVASATEILVEDFDIDNDIEVTTEKSSATELLELTARPEHATKTTAWDAHQVVTEIYQTHYKSLVRLALLLVHDVPTAEEVVQDAFEAMHTASRRLRDTEKALSYLRQAVVNKSRSVLRHRTVIDKNAPKPAPDEPSAELGALAAIERIEVVAALRTLPDRQREALVLRYYVDLSEADIAATMGISRGAVKSHTARGMSALRSLLEQETP